MSKHFHLRHHIPDGHGSTSPVVTFSPVALAVSSFGSVFVVGGASKVITEQDGHEEQGCFAWKRSVLLADTPAQVAAGTNREPKFTKTVRLSHEFLNTLFSNHRHSLTFFNRKNTFFNESYFTYHE